jgi:hypothetical protein
VPDLLYVLYAMLAFAIIGCLSYVASSFDGARGRQGVSAHQDCLPEHGRNRRQRRRVVNRWDGGISLLYLTPKEKFISLTWHRESGPIKQT